MKEILVLGKPNFFFSGGACSSTSVEVLVLGVGLREAQPGMRERVRFPL